MHPPFFQGVLVPLNMTNPVRFMTNPCLTNRVFKLPYVHIILLCYQICL